MPTKCSDNMAKIGHAILHDYVNGDGNLRAATEIMARLVWGAMERQRLTEDKEFRQAALKERNAANYLIPGRHRNGASLCSMQARKHHSSNQDKS